MENRPFVPMGGFYQDSQQGFLIGVIVERTTPIVPRLSWKHNHPVWVNKRSLSNQKLRTIGALIEEQLSKGHIVETSSPCNSSIFVLKKPGKERWRLLLDVRKINEAIEDMSPLQPGLPSPSMLPQDWKVAIINIKDCFFNIPLHL